MPCPSIEELFFVRLEHYEPRPYCHKIERDLDSMPRLVERGKLPLDVLLFSDMQKLHRKELKLGDIQLKFVLKTFGTFFRMNRFLSLLIFQDLRGFHQFR